MPMLVEGSIVAINVKPYARVALQDSYLRTT